VWLSRVSPSGIKYTLVCFLSAIMVSNYTQNILNE
jgi:hypothetical protein